MVAWAMVAVLFRNKYGIGHSREVDEEESKSLAETEGLYIIETWALENLNVEESLCKWTLE